MRRIKPLAAVSLLALLSLGACGLPQRIAQIGVAPPMSPVPEIRAPQRQASLGQPGLIDQREEQASMPPAAAAQPTPGGTSLWRTGSSAFFRDQRATRVGDILTVEIAINDKAELGNTTTRTRSNSENAGLANLLGFETKFASVLPNAVDPSKLIDGSSSSKTSGDGSVKRNEAVNLTVAAIVTRVLPNGNLLIQGRQEVRVNFEVRELVITGIVRPEDITRNNTIRHTQIAEARIAYGGRGQLTDVQQARYGQQLYDILFPF